MKSIAIFYASEGTGHRSAAEALRDQYVKDNPNGNVLCKDILEYAPTIFRKMISHSYVLMAHHAPWLWGLFYWSSDKPSFASSCFDKIHEFLCKKYLPRAEKELRKHSVEAVFFTHYFGAAPLARRNINNFPVFYINTDFICHRFQINSIFKTSFVASPIAVKQHWDRQIKAVIDTGIPVPPKYLSLLSKSDARKKLNFKLTDKIVLVSGGGIGGGSVLNVTKSLSEHTNIKIAVVCGNNKALYNKLRRLFMTYSNVYLEKFIPNMEDYYAAADVGIMKPGGLSLSEALAAKLPVLLMDPIPGQEQLNMDYLYQAGAIQKLKNSKNSYEEVSRFLYEKDSLDKMLTRMERISRPSAAKEILEIAKRQL